MLLKNALEPSRILRDMTVSPDTDMVRLLLEHGAATDTNGDLDYLLAWCHTIKAPSKELENMILNFRTGSFSNTGRVLSRPIKRSQDQSEDDEESTQAKKKTSSLCPDQSTRPYKSYVPKCPNKMLC